MGRAQKWLKVAFVSLIVILEVLGWLMAAGGIGRLHDTCRNSETSFICGKTYRAEWWSIFFQLLVMVLVGLSAVLSSCDRVQVPLVAFLAMSSLKLMGDAENALDSSIERAQYEENALRSFSVGLIIMITANFVLIWGVGSNGVPDLTSVLLWIQKMNDGKLNNVPESGHSNPVIYRAGVQQPNPCFTHLPVVALPTKYSARHTIDAAGLDCNDNPAGL